MEVSLQYTKPSGKWVNVHATGRWEIRTIDGDARLYIEVYTESVAWSTVQVKYQRRWWQAKPSVLSHERVPLQSPIIRREKWWSHEDHLSVVCRTVNTCSDA